MGDKYMCNIKIPDEYKLQVNPSVAVNQIAYGVNDSKIAVVKDDIEGKCYLCNAISGEAIYEAELSMKKFDSTNLVYVRHFDFSDVKEVGKYYISTPQGISYTFEISEKPYKEVTDAMIKALYFQRCGMDLEEKYAGPYTHKACHNLPAYLLDNPNVIIDDVSGGWHDAGDYGKYITPANQTVFNMMYAYELFSEGVNDDLNIPETGNGVPDILNEAKYELDWMLKMQDKDSGGVYHKVSTEKFAGNDMPDTDTEKWEIQCISPIMIPATAGFAAAMAIAARVYKKFYPDWANTCLEASKKAFNYAINSDYMNAKPFENIEPCVTGAYGDECCLDEIYWAAAELFRTTGEKYYEEKFAEFYKLNFSKVDFGAYYQGGHGSFAYCLADGANEELRAKVLKDIIDGAQEALEVYNRNAYLLCLHDGVNKHENEYYWGSNAVLTNKLANMVSAAYLTKTDKYDKAIKDSISYIFGRNYISKCYVTGFGANTVKNPHHRPSFFDGVDEPIPGFVAGGPNDRQGQRPALVEGVKQFEGIDWDNMPPAGCYVDWEWNWSTNEITIYWNSSCFYITGYLNSKY